MPNGVNVSRDLLWILTRNNNSHMFRRKGIKKTFTSDPLNPRGVQTLRNSSVQPEAISVVPHQSGKGIELVYKNRRNQRKPAKALTRVRLTKGSRKSLVTIRRVMNKNKYRQDLKMSVLRRASALLLAQKPKTPKRGKGGKGKKAE